MATRDGCFVCFALMDDVVLDCVYYDGLFILNLLLFLWCYLWVMIRLGFGYWACLYGYCFLCISWVMGCLT